MFVSETIFLLLIQSTDPIGGILTFLMKTFAPIGSVNCSGALRISDAFAKWCKKMSEHCIVPTGIMTCSAKCLIYYYTIDLILVFIKLTHM